MTKRTAIKRIKHLLFSDRGEVALEFLLVLPIYLLLLGGTMLLYEILLGRLHLQEANRNLAWVAGDRHAVDTNEAKSRLVNKITAYYANRNVRESAMGSTEEYWRFPGSPDYWAVSIASKQTADGVFLPETEWGMLAAGNMGLRMSRVSSAFLGLIAVSYVFSPEKDGQTPLYAKSFDLTRTKVPESSSDVSGIDFQPESYLFRRRGDETYRNGNSMESVYSVISENWPDIDRNNGGSGIQLQASDPSSGSTSDDQYQRILSAWAQ